MHGALAGGAQRSVHRRLAVAAKSNDKKEVKVLAKQTEADPGLAQGAHPTYMNT